MKRLAPWITVCHYYNAIHKRHRIDTLAHLNKILQRICSTQFSRRHVAVQIPRDQGKQSLPLREKWPY